MTHTSSHPVISLKNIQKNFYLGKNEVRALTDVSLDITPGEYVILYGRLRVRKIHVTECDCRA